MKNSKIFLTCFLWICMYMAAWGQSPSGHVHETGEKCLSCKATELNEEAARREAEYTGSRRSRLMRSRAVQATPPDDFEFVIPVVFHVFGTEFNDGTKVTVDLIRDALVETNKDFWGLQEDWQRLHPARDTVKKALKMTFRLAEKDPDGNPTTGVTFHEWKAGFGNGSGYDAEIQKYAWDNYRYVNVYIMQDLYDDGKTNNSGVSWYPYTWMSDANLARVVYNGSYLGTNTDAEFRSVLSHEFGHFFNLKHTFEGCETQITYPNDEIDDTPAHLYDLTLQEGAKNPFGEVIDVCNFMNYPRQYKNFTKGQVARMKEALMHPARITLWQEENHKKVFYTEPTPRIELAVHTIHEDLANDGSFTENYLIRLWDASLKKAAHEYLDAQDYTVTGLPAGLTLKLKVNEDGHLAGELQGKAGEHAIKDNGDFHVVLKNTLLTEGKIINPEFDLSYTFRDPYTIVHGDTEGIAISAANNWKFFSLGIGNADYGAWFANDAQITNCYKLQTYKKPLVAYPGTLNIKALELGTEIGETSDWVTPIDEYAGVLDLKSADYNEWVGRNAYVGIQFDVDGETLFGWMNVSFNPAGDGYTIHDWAYHTKPGGMIRAGETADGIPEKIVISPAGIAEAVSNDGTVAGKLAIQIAGVSTEFVKEGLLVAGEDYTITGIPEGLSVKITLTGKTTGEIEFSGKALKHTKADQTKIELQLDKSLVNNPELTGLKNSIEVGFLDPYGIFYKDIDDIWIAASGSWTEFSFGIGNADFELWFAERLGGRFKFVSANNPLVAYTGTSNIVPLKFGEVIGENLADGMDWKQQKSGVPQAEIDESMLDLKSDSFLEWVGQTAYVGLQFRHNGLTHYGWVGIRFEKDGKMMTLEDWAYNEAPGEQIQAGYKIKDQKPYLAWPDTVLYESALNDGSLDSISVKVKGTTFAAAPGQKLKAGTDYSADALPEGLSLTIEVKDPLTAEIQISGKALQHAAADSIKNWKLRFHDAAFTASPVAEKEKAFHFYFTDPYHLIYVDIEDIPCNATDNFKVFHPIEGYEDIDYGVWYNEGALRLEAYGKNIICTNTGESTAYVTPLSKGYLITENDSWNTGGEYPDEHWIWGPAYKDWAGKEAYLGFAFELNDGFHFGWMRLEVAADGSAYVLKDYAYHTGPNVPVRAGDKGIEEPAYIVVDHAVFHEGMDNDGAITDSVQIDLVGGTYARNSGFMVEGTDYTVSGLSEGLILKAELVGADKLVLKLEGKAIHHDRTAAVKNVKFVFLDAAFGAGTTLSEKTVKLSIDYIDPYRVVYVDIHDISCSRYNTWQLLDIDGNAYGIWYDIDGGLLLRLETYGAPLVCEGNSRNITPLRAGELVGPGSNWVAGADWPDEHNLHTPEYTVWREKEAYVGIKYDFNGRTRYGWIRMEVSADGQSYVVKDYAYNEVFDEPILTGSMKRQELMVDFTADQTAIYETFGVKYTNHTFSASAVRQYFWTFEGGEPAVYEGENPGIITYAHSGEYAVSLKVETADTTITKTRTGYMVVRPIMLKADYTVSASNLVEGGKVKFEDASSGSFDIVKWEWTFEGGQPSTFEGQHPGEVVYATAGAYEVILKVTDSEGHVHTRFATPGITVFPADYKDYCPVSVIPPTANTYCYITNVQVGEQVNASESDDYTDYSRTVRFAAQKGEVLPFDVALNNNRQEARVMAWVDWNGNGVFEDTETVANFISNYDRPDNLTLDVPEDAVNGIVGMRVRAKVGDQVLNPCDDEGYYGEIEDYSLVISNPAPTGDILADKQHIKSGEQVVFRANINEITDAGVESYHWIFEGGTPAFSDERVPEAVQYIGEGVHSVILELHLQGGEKKIVEKKNFVVVNPAITLAKFDASATDIVKGGSVRFTDRSESSAGIASWEWTFEGGNPSAYDGQTPPAIVYDRPGTYEVILKITDVNGEHHTQIQPLMIEVYESTNSYCTVAEGGSYYSIVKVAVGDQKYQTTHEPAHWVNGYTDFAFVVTRDTILPFSVDLSTEDSPARVMAWIDWNQDGVFDEATETIIRYQDDSKPAEIRLSVPADAKEGATRMRVRTSYYEYKSPCDPMSSMGELEDYTLIVKKERPQGYIVADQTNPVVGGQVQFTAFVNQITDENVTAYKWVFHGGTPAQSTERKPEKVTYAAEGVYDVRLELTLEGGVKKNIVMYDFITVGEKAPDVQVDFAASPLEISAGSSVDFSASVTGTGTITSYSWTFEGGTPATSASASPAVGYAVSGSYDVMLTVTLNDGFTRTIRKSNYITVNPFLLRADFTASATKVNSGTEVVFINKSTGAETYQWDFGDGTTAVRTENASHVFANAGTYMVTLTITGQGETQTKTTVVTVSAMKPADCELTGTYTEWATMKKVQFGEISNDAERTQFYHDFTGNAPFRMEKGQAVAYTLQAKNAGWPVGVYVWIDWNNDGHFDDATERVLAFRADQETDPATGTIHVPADAVEGMLRMRIATDYYNEDIVNHPLTACGSPYAVEEYAVRIGAGGGEEEWVMNMVADPVEVRENEPVKLSVEGVPEDATYVWTFEGADVAGSTEATPVVSYGTAGAYDVKVVVSLPNGQSGTLQENRFIVVRLAKVAADFTADKNLCAVGEEVNFTSTAVATADIQSFTWTFEGGEPATSQAENPTVVYAVPGKYDVTLKVTDKFGKTDTKVMPEFIEAKEFIKADFTVSARKVAVGEEVRFTNRSVAAARYQWTFDNGDPATSTEANPTVRFNVKGAALVTLLAEDAEGKRSMKSEVLTVTPAAFGAIQLDNLVQEYDGEVKAVGYTVIPAELEGHIRIEYRQNGVEVSPKEAGMYDVTASYIGDIPYSVELVNARFEIRKKSIRILAADLRQTYNGQVLKAKISTWPEGFEEQVNVTYFQDGEPVEPLNSGVYQIRATLEDANHEAPVLEEEFAIRKQTGLVDIQLEEEYQYDGTQKFVRNVVTSPVGLNTVVTYNGHPEGAVDAGDYAVFASIQDINYEGIDDAVLTVKAAVPEVNILQDQFLYDGTPHELLYEIRPEGLESEINYAKEGETVDEVVNSGIYDYTIRISGDNYNTVYTGKMKVLKAAARIKITGLRAIYDGEKKEVRIETEPAGLPVYVTYDGFDQLPSAPGTYKVFAESEAENYEGYKTAVFQIVRNASDMEIMNLVVSDGTRDCIFRVPELEQTDKSLVMYNEQGTVVFEAKAYYDDFDMRDLPAGTYYYILTYEEDGILQTIKNFVEVIRK